MKFSHRFRFFTGLLTLSLVGSLCFSPVSAEAAKKASKRTAAQIAAEKAAAEQIEAERQAAYNKDIDSNAIDGWPQGPQIYAESAIVMEASSGAILYNKDMDMKNYPASITKIMTALLTLENCSLDETVTYSYNATHTIDAGSSSIYTTEDEQLTVEQSLYALMLESANECANGLAEHVAGSIDAFAEMMNQKAAELGCTNTHFTNANGLHNDEHYTSAHDMALITQAAIQNEDFLRISGTAKYQMQPTNKRDEITYMTNHHYMIAPYKGITKYLDDSVIAGKTGNTSVAKGTLVTVAERNGMTLIVVTMRTQSTGEKGVPLFTDTALLLDYASENFTPFNVSENETNFSVSGSSYIGKMCIRDSFAMHRKYAVRIISCCKTRTRLRALYAHGNILAVDTPVLHVAIGRVELHIHCQNLGLDLIRIGPDQLFDLLIALAGNHDLVGYLEICLFPHGLHLADDLADKALLDQFRCELGVQHYGDGIVTVRYKAFGLRHVNQQILFR